MRIYISSAEDGFHAVAPEVPGVCCSGATREAAISLCRRRIKEELAVYKRLGTPLQVSSGIIELSGWEQSGPAIFAEELIPADRELVKAVVGRIEEARSELDRLLDALTPAEWQAQPQGQRSIRSLVDHIANSQWLIMQRLDIWPLDLAQAQRQALRSLCAQLRTFEAAHPGRIVEHFGLDSEHGRVCWTPRKVLRVTQALQEGWLAHLAGRGAEPAFPMGHGDDPSDRQPVEEQEIQSLLERGLQLIEASTNNRRAAGRLAQRYRYYRNRLVAWPDDARARWAAIWEMSRTQLLSLSEAEMALIRVLPLSPEDGGGYGSVRQTLSLSLAHLQEHSRQIWAQAALLRR